MEPTSGQSSQISFQIGCFGYMLGTYVVWAYLGCMWLSRCSGLAVSWRYIWGRLSRWWSVGRWSVVGEYGFFLFCFFRTLASELCRRTYGTRREKGDRTGQGRAERQMQGGGRGWWESGGHVSPKGARIHAERDASACLAAREVVLHDAAPPRLKREGGKEPTHPR